MQASSQSSLAVLSWDNHLKVLTQLYRSLWLYILVLSDYQTQIRWEYSKSTQIYKKRKLP